MFLISFYIIENVENDNGKFKDEMVLLAARERPFALLLRLFCLQKEYFHGVLFHQRKTIFYILNLIRFQKNQNEVLRKFRHSFF